MVSPNSDANVTTSIQLCPWNVSSPTSYESQYANPNFQWTDMTNVYNTPFPTNINDNQTGCCYNI